jgi:acid phosphatase family membrane protein YuiD
LVFFIVIMHILYEALSMSSIFACCSEAGAELAAPGSAIIAAIHNKESPMDLAYLVTPLITWTVVGPLKFLINSIRTRQWAFGLVGNGGFPSNHSAVVSSMATLIALREGMSEPAFGVAVTLAFIVIIDANSLRRHVGKQAAAINRIATDDPQHGHLRERMGHTLVEIAGGLCTGVAIAFAIDALLGRGW